MQTIKATIGERILNDNGEVIKYIGGQTDNGECYKDLDAWKSGEGVIYISEYGLIDLDNGSRNCDDAMWTRESWLEWVRIEVKEVIGEGVEDFSLHIAECVLDMCDWQDLSTLLNEINIAEEYQYWRENIKKVLTMAKFSVWVGGVEVNDYYLHEEEARAVANYYERLGYDDVEIEKMW